jgi:hypothetical protein
MQAPIDADALLGDLLATLARDLPLKPQCRHWLLEGLAALARGEASSLDAALGLRRHAGQSARLSRRLRLAARDAHLADALAAVAFDANLSAWERCRRLAREVERFNRTWHSTRLLPAPRHDWPAVRRCLWAAAMMDLPLPGSAHALHRAVARTTPFSRNGETPRLRPYADNSHQWTD